MLEFFHVIPFTYAALFPVLNPFSGAMLFLNLTHDLPKEVRVKLAQKVGINTFILLIIVLLTGSWVLQFFGITISIVQIGGGIVVASLGWKLLNQPTQKSEEPKIGHSEKDVNEMAFFPLTMPLTAGPGSIAVTLTIGAHEVNKTVLKTVLGQVSAMVGILLLAITVWICYQQSDKLTKRMGRSGTLVIMRLSAFINMCIGLQIIWNGIQTLLVGIF